MKNCNINEIFKESNTEKVNKQKKKIFAISIQSVLKLY